MENKDVIVVEVIVRFASMILAIGTLGVTDLHVQGPGPRILQQVLRKEVILSVAQVSGRCSVTALCKGGVESVQINPNHM